MDDEQIPSNQNDIKKIADGNAPTIITNANEHIVALLLTMRDGPTLKQVLAILGVEQWL